MARHHFCELHEAVQRLLAKASLGGWVEVRQKIEAKLANRSLSRREKVRLRALRRRVIQEGARAGWRHAEREHIQLEQHVGAIQTLLARNLTETEMASARLALANAVAALHRLSGDLLFRQQLGSKETARVWFERQRTLLRQMQTQLDGKKSVEMRRHAAELRLKKQRRAESRDRARVGQR